MPPASRPCVRRLRLGRANYMTGGRTHGLEIHGPGASAFIDCVRENRRPLTDIAEGVKSMKFVDLLRAGRI